VSFARLYRETGKREIGREVALPAGGPSSAVGPVADVPSPSRQASDREQDQVLQEALQRLPDNYRDVLHLRYHEERSFDEIGRMMNLSPNATRKLWLRAVKRLQQESATS
jgi:RNA polymerase sigma-70 factor (ECF subfamily)